MLEYSVFRPFCRESRSESRALCSDVISGTSPSSRVADSHDLIT